MHTSAVNTFVPGLRRNWKQFTILVIVNAFVGGMVGMERSILPLIAQDDFNITAAGIILSFIVIFGISKAIANYFTGRLANSFGRKKLLIAGWLIALPLPFILMFADNWSWIVLANILLGIHQGFAWSSTVVMKMDIVNEKERGFAMGLNEFSGYLAVAAVAYLTAHIAAEYGLRPYPFYIGVVLVVAGLFFTLFFVNETSGFASNTAASSTASRMKNIFTGTSFTNKNLSAITQAGLVNNLNDGMVWGLLPLVLAAKSFSFSEIGIVAGIYPAVWGLAQIFTGKLTDHFGRKPFLVWGMLLQGLAIIAFIPAQTLAHYISLSVLLGLGTAMVYPTFLAAIADNTHPEQRPESVGVFRLWRDLGYAVGALLTGILAWYSSMQLPILVIGILTILSALVVLFRFKNN
jgi:MFS family permease